MTAVFRAVIGAGAAPDRQGRAAAVPGPHLLPAGHGAPQPQGGGEAAHQGHPGPARGPGNHDNDDNVSDHQCDALLAGCEQERGGAEHTVPQQEEGGGGLHAHHGGGAGGALGGRPEDPLPLRQAQPRPGIRPGHERDHRPHLLRPRLRLRRQQRPWRRLAAARGS